MNRYFEVRLLCVLRKAKEYGVSISLVGCEVNSTKKYLGIVLRGGLLGYCISATETSVFAVFVIFRCCHVYTFKQCSNWFYFFKSWNVGNPLVQLLGPLKKFSPGNLFDFFFNRVLGTQIPKHFRKNENERIVNRWSWFVFGRPDFKVTRRDTQCSPIETWVNSWIWQHDHCSLYRTNLIIYNLKYPEWFNGCSIVI